MTKQQQPTWLGLKPSQNPQCLVLRPNEPQVFDVSSQKEFSVRQSDKKWISSVRNTLRRMWAIVEGESSSHQVAWLAFTHWVVSQVNECEDYSNYFGEGVEISRSWATNCFLVFCWYLGKGSSL